MQSKLLFSFSAFIFLFISCNHSTEKKLFTKLPATQSGVFFNNEIDEKKFDKKAMNEFGYMGGGVGIGDFNNDGLKDIFFCGNQVSSKLYLNKGDNKFEDITKAAGVETTIWSTGVSVADVNNDGWDDMFVCTYGKGMDKKAHNLLFINQHNNTFKEQAKDYGIADSSYSTQAAFFDYDRDGDLDMFLVNYNLNTSYSANTIFPKNNTGNSIANDQLYRNEGIKNGIGHPVFTNVTIAAGILEDGYGLGVSVTDFNSDGWPDLYVCNDFVSNDELWLNNKNGSFTNVVEKSTKHQSYSSMGCDAADVNNDQLIDFATVDMMPEDNKRKKLTNFFMNYDRYEAERNLSYSPEFTRNMLQLNNGNYFSKDTALPFFSEIGQLAGISETDWSWSVLLADFNSDGWKDMHITNGIGRDFINADFLQFTKTVGISSGNPADARKVMNEKLESLDHVRLPNYFYLNNADYTFANQSEAAGIDEAEVSCGAAYVDLDNDGDLDLVVNNINSAAFLFINNTFQKNKIAESHSISFNLKGDSLNTKGIGSKLYLYTNGQPQLQEQSPIRGYLSSVDSKIIFGIGENKQVDSLLVIWPNQKKQLLTRLTADTTYILNEQDAFITNAAAKEANNTLKLFEDITSISGAAYTHKDVPFYDYGTQRLLPQKFSQLGPFVATADINNDGFTDFFIGGGFNSYGQVFTQNSKGDFGSKNLYTGIKFREDMDCVFLDADGDKDQDLLITYGDMRYDDTSSFYHPQLFLNDGKGNFSVNSSAIPASVKTIAGTVAAGDYDGDGDLDLFIGGRVSKKYPLPPNSYILQNNSGVFTDVTKAVCPALQHIGMVTSSVWTDFDNDKKMDLVVAGEWMPIQFFKNEGKVLKDITTTIGIPQMNGMWRCLIAADIDKDGDKDFVAGNLGLNCKYHVSINEPMKLFANDIDGNGSIDPVMFYYIKKDNKGAKFLYPSIAKDVLAEQVPGIKKHFLKNADYVNATVENIYSEKKDLLEFTCNETASCWIENIGNGKFLKHLLPMQAQFAPINTIVCTDADNDGINDFIMAGNEYQTEVSTGRYDASYGFFLKGNSKKTFTAISQTVSGFRLNGDVKKMKFITNAKSEKILMVAINNDSLRMFGINKK